MNLKLSKEIVNQAIDIAIQKGCFNLSEVQKIVDALEKINSMQDIEFGDVIDINK